MLLSEFVFLFRNSCEFLDFMKLFVQIIYILLSLKGQ